MKSLYRNPNAIYVRCTVPRCDEWRIGRTGLCQRHLTRRALGKPLISESEALRPPGPLYLIPR